MSDRLSERGWGRWPCPVLIERGTQVAVDEAIAVQGKMPELNPEDNRGVHDRLVGCYSRRKRHANAANLLRRDDAVLLASALYFFNR